ncbi:MAG: hypothetical protein LBB31_02950, partial [Prevotellaceae bacterium]|nr:hypothetical protein [Prevotellaceae bacterium]
MLLLLFLFPLWGFGGFSAAAQVTVSNVTVNYPAKQVSFTVSWTTQPYNDQIWVIADYIKTDGATIVGGWSPATITGATVTGNGTATAVAGSRGFWLNTSGATGSANVTAALSLAAGVDKFIWCAFGLNYPPKATIKAGGGYDLHGSKPFTVTYNTGSSATVNATTFNSGCITAITDATGNPAGIIPAAPTVSASNPAAFCSPGTVTLNATAGGVTTPSMTYTWTVGGDA